MNNLGDAVAHTGAQLTHQKDQLDAVRGDVNIYKEAFIKMMSNLQKNQPSKIPTNADGLYDNPVAAVEDLFKNPNLSISAEQHATLSTDALAAHTGLTVLENRVSAIDSELQGTTKAVNDLEQYIRGWNILIHGLTNLPVRPQGAKVDDFEFTFIEYICDVLNRHLGNYLYQLIQPYDIERAHILYQGEEKSDKPVVIVRFVRRVVRNNVFFKRRYLKNSHISISDHLSALNRKILYAIKPVAGKENTWTCHGTVFANLDGKRYEFKSMTAVNYVKDNREKYGLPPCHEGEDKPADDPESSNMQPRGRPPRRSSRDRLPASGSISRKQFAPRGGRGSGGRGSGGPGRGGRGRGGNNRNLRPLPPKEDNRYTKSVFNN